MRAGVLDSRRRSVLSSIKPEREKEVRPSPSFLIRAQLLLGTGHQPEHPGVTGILGARLSRKPQPGLDFDPEYWFRNSTPSHALGDRQMSSPNRASGPHPRSPEGSIPPMEASGLTRENSPWASAASYS